MHPPLEACSSLQSLAPTARAAAAGGGGKSSHMAAVRSLGLLHELRSAVGQLQSAVESQEAELERLRSEKQEAVRELRREQQAPDKQPYLQHFQATELADLPPRLRALFEDNKVLKESVRRYRSRVQEAERSSSQQEQLLLSLRQQVKQLREQLAEGAASPEALAAEQQLREHAAASQRALEKLQHAQGVLQGKLETDARSHRQALATAARERRALEQQVQQLAQALEDKDKQARAAALAAKQAEQRLAEVRAAASRAVAGVDAAVAREVALEAARHKQAADAGVHLMLCILHDEGAGGGGGGAQTGAGEEQAAAGGRQAACAGAGGGGGEGGVGAREQAALVLQAGARGFLARKATRLRRELGAAASGAGAAAPEAARWLHGDELAACEGPAAARQGAAAGGSDSAAAACGQGRQSAAGDALLCPGAGAAALTVGGLPLELPPLPPAAGELAGAGAPAPPQPRAAAGGGAHDQRQALTSAPGPRPAAAGCSWRLSRRSSVGSVGAVPRALHSTATPPKQPPQAAAAGSVAPRGQQARQSGAASQPSASSGRSSGMRCAGSGGGGSRLGSSMQPNDP